MAALASSSSASAAASGAGDSSASAAAAPRYGRPSARLDPHRLIDPFATKGSSASASSAFAALYAQGEVPCHIDHHGSGKNHIQWKSPPHMLDYARFLPAFMDGIRETKHPLVFLARQGLRELLAADGAGAKATPLVPGLVRPLRAALVDRSEGVFPAALEALRQLSAAVGPALNPFLDHLVIQVNKKAFDAKLKEDVMTTLQVLDSNGGPDALAIIKSKVPTYVSIG
jgi:hypothetical protein